MDKNQTWSLFIFAFNEEASIFGVSQKALGILEKLTPLEKELIIVNDGSTDNTLKIIEDLKEKNPQIVVINHPKNQGIGRALISGYKACRFENVCAIPGDGQFNMEELLPFANVPAKTIVSFYRNKNYRYTLFRKFLSKTNSFLNRFILGIKLKDVNWIKIYKKEFFNEIPMVSTSSLVESEICAKMLRKNYNVIEVPSAYQERMGGKSHGASFKTIFLACRELIQLYWSIRISGK
jgi:glycosyltransferase involved in cell wall biosynthesis